MSELVKKYKIALFLDSSATSTPNWLRIKKSTALDLALNPETQDFDFIVDQSPTTELMRYKLSLNQVLTMYKGEPDYEYMFNKFFNLKTGEKAKQDVLIVFMQESEVKEIPGAEENDDPVTRTYYKAWKNEAVLTISNFNAVDSTLTFDINFGGKVVQGECYADAESKPVFTATGGSDDVWVDPFGA